MRATQLVFALSACALSCLPARADIVQLPTPLDLNMTGDRLISIPGTAGTYIPSPLVFNAGAEVVTISQASGKNFLMVFTGGSMGANFLYNDAAENLTPSPMQIAFGTPLTEFGAQFINNTPKTGTQTFTFGVYNGPSLLGTFTVSGPSTSVSFFGVRAINHEQFDRIAISSNSNDFAVCACEIAIAPVPEPAAAFLLAGALGVVYAARRRERSRK